MEAELQEQVGGLENATRVAGEGLPRGAAEAEVCRLGAEISTFWAGWVEEQQCRELGEMLVANGSRPCERRMGVSMERLEQERLSSRKQMEEVGRLLPLRHGLEAQAALALREQGCSERIRELEEEHRKRLGARKWLETRPLRSLRQVQAIGNKQRRSSSKARALDST